MQSRLAVAVVTALGVHVHRVRWRGRGRHAQQGRMRGLGARHGPADPEQAELRRNARAWNVHVLRQATGAL